MADTARGPLASTLFGLLLGVAAIVGLSVSILLALIPPAVLGWLIAELTVRWAGAAAGMASVFVEVYFLRRYSAVIVSSLRKRMS